MLTRLMIALIVGIALPLLARPLLRKLPPEGRWGIIPVVLALDIALMAWLV